MPGVDLTVGRWHICRQTAHAPSLTRLPPPPGGCPACRGPGGRAGGGGGGGGLGGGKGVRRRGITCQPGRGTLCRLPPPPFFLRISIVRLCRIRYAVTRDVPVPGGGLQRCLPPRPEGGGLHTVLSLTRAGSGNGLADGTRRPAGPQEGPCAETAVVFTRCGYECAVSWRGGAAGVAARAASDAVADKTGIAGPDGPGNVPVVVPGLRRTPRCSGRFSRTARGAAARKRPEKARFRVLLQNKTSRIAN